MTTELDPGAAPGISTISTYAGYADSILRHKKRQVCVYDGVEIGSTGRIEEWSYRDVSAVTANKLIIANDNYAPEMAMAA